MANMPSKIKFGTSGWRAVIAEEFTFDNVRKVVEAIARHVNSSTPKSVAEPSLIVGYDTRFLSEKFAVIAAEILTGQGIRCYLSNGAVPTPTVAFEIRQRKTQ